MNTTYANLGALGWGETVGGSATHEHFTPRGLVVRVDEPCPPRQPQTQPQAQPRAPSRTGTLTLARPGAAALRRRNGRAGRGEAARGPAGRQKAPGLSGHGPGQDGGPVAARGQRQRAVPRVGKGPREDV
eukprot:scaffold129637_cov48-Phaeocystis_antarctica.AAC.2